MYLRILAVIVVLACAFSPATRADNQETMTLEEFQEFGELVMGRWVVDIKFVADWPGEDLGRGDRLVGYSHFTWLVDKMAIQGMNVGGNNSGVYLMVWDAATKQIKSLGTGTSGSTLEVVTWKKSDGVYGWRITGGSLLDERTHSGSGEWVFSEDRKTMTIQGQTELGGAPLDPLKDVYRRLSP